MSGAISITSTANFRRSQKLRSPLHCKGRLVGVMDAQSPQLDGFTPEQLQLLTAFADSIASAIEKRAAIPLRAATERAHFSTSRMKARMIQSALSAAVAIHRFPDTRWKGIACRSVPWAATGMTTLPIDDHRVGDHLGRRVRQGYGCGAFDVGPRGPSSAATLPAEAIPPTYLRGGECITACGLSARPVFVTLIYAVLDAGRHTLTFASAGHLPPVVARGEDCTCILTESGLPLGIFDSDFF